MKKPLSFRLGGKSIALLPESRIVKTIKAWLDKQKDGELFSPAELCRATGYSAGSIHANSEFTAALSDYGAIIRYPNRRKVWGNRRTIQELRKHKGIVA